MNSSAPTAAITVAMPGSDGTVAGTAISEWLDDEGNPKYGEQSEDKD